MNPEEQNKFYPNPLDCPTYFSSPVEIIVRSVQDAYLERISLHEVADAYSTFSVRLLDHADDLSRVDCALAALDLVRAQASIIITALRRDIRRAFIDPVPESSPPDPSFNSEDSIFLEQQGPTDEELKDARDQTYVCHHSLHLVSNIFSLPALQQLFSVDELDELFEHSSSIAFTTTLPMLSASKNRNFCLWMLRTQRLPFHFLMRKSDRLVAGLTDVIEAEIDIDSVTESLKAILHLIKCHPATYVPRFSDFLPSLLRLLISPSLHLRREVAHILSTFAHTTATSPTPSNIRNSISKHILSFIDTQASKEKSEHSISHLPYLLKFTLENPSQEFQPQWVVSVLSSLILLSDAAIFLHERAIKLIFPLLGQVYVHHFRSVRGWYFPLWKCVVWTFARLKDTPRDELDERWKKRDVEQVYDSAFRLCNEEIREDIGAAIVGTVLGRTEGANPAMKDVAKALESIIQLVALDDRRDLGISILTQITSGIGSSSSSVPSDISKSRDEWDYSRIVAKEFLDGSILEASRPELQALASGAQSVKINTIRYLSEGEVCEHWDLLLQIWINCVAGFQRARVPVELIQVWQALLLSQTQLTQELGHFTTPPEFSHKAVSVVVDFLQPTMKLEMADRLALVLRLWTVMKNVFASAWLSLSAESILSKLMSVEFEGDVKGMWTALCIDLVAYGVPSVLDKILANSDSERRNDEIRRMLWRIVVENWDTYEKLGWETALGLLLAPVRLEPTDVALWDTLLNSAIRIASASLVPSVVVIEHLIKRAGEHAFGFDHVPILLSRVDFSDNDAPSIVMSSLINEWLRNKYPLNSEEQIVSIRAVMQNITRIISSIPGVRVVPFLVSIIEGLCIWIKDESESLSDIEYNNTVMSFYEQVLIVLQTLPPSIETLHSLTPFLVSSFSRIPPPAIGPMTFKKFWDSTYQGQIASPGNYPEAIKHCLRAYHEVYGGDPPTGITIGSSQDPDSSPVPSPDTSKVLNMQEVDENISIPSLRQNRNTHHLHKKPQNYFDAARDESISQQVFSHSGVLDDRSPSRMLLSDNNRVPSSQKRRRISEPHQTTSKHLADPDSTALTTQGSADNPTRERKDNELIEYRSTPVAVENPSPDVKDDDEYDWRNDVGLTSHEIRQHLNNDQTSFYFEVPDIDMSELDLSSEAVINGPNEASTSSNDRPNTRKRGIVEDNGGEQRLDVVPSDLEIILGHREPVAAENQPSVEELQRALDAMLANGSQLSIGELVRASNLARELEIVLQEKIQRKLARSRTKENEDVDVSHSQR